MKRQMLLIAACAVMLATPAAAARTYFGFQIGITNAPPPPRIYIRDEPDVIFVPSTRVYVVRNDDQFGVDMFRYGRFWYCTRDGYWYRGARLPRSVPCGRRAIRAASDLLCPGEPLAASSA